MPGITTILGDLWLLDLVTGKERLLVKQVGSYTWSPDSTQIAYITPTESEGTTGALYISDVKGETKQVAEVDFLGSDYKPQWLPTNEIVYVRDGQLWSFQTVDKTENMLSGFRFFSWVAVEEGERANLADSDTPIGFRFSPDGKRVAYKTRSKNELAIAYRLWLADTNGNNAKLITEQAEGSYYEWSLNSEWLVFNTYRDVNNPTPDEHLPSVQGLWTIKGDGSDVHPLHKMDNWQFVLSPAWSPDSSMIVFIESKTVESSDPLTGVFNEGDIKVANVTEKDAAVTLVGLPKDVVAPILVWWSPDGQYLFTLKNGDVLGEYKSDRLTLAVK